ncbi:MAG: fumarylacetoacetate hydrolase family protein [Euzebya sp.]
MRLLSVRTAQGHRAGRLDGDDVVLLPFSDVGALLASGDDWRAAAEASGPSQPYEGSDLAPVVPAPSKVLCLGLNYASHILEMGRELPPHPTMFAKFARTLTGPNDPITLPTESDEVDWEVELALVIGATARHVSVDQAGAVIAGYTIANDISMRDWQWRSAQWLQGKMFEASTPVGPMLVTTDEFDGDPGAPDVEVICEVDGQVMQQSRTGDLLFTPADIVAYASSILTLDPGDLLLTGTPGGVGAGRDPKVFLKPGQTVRTSIEGIGQLSNLCQEPG